MPQGVPGVFQLCNCSPVTVCGGVDDALEHTLPQAAPTLAPGLSAEERYLDDDNPHTLDLLPGQTNLHNLP